MLMTLSELVTRLDCRSLILMFCSWSVRGASVSVFYQ